jgi:DNA polymerase III gamma/tau subunit
MFSNELKEKYPQLTNYFKNGIKSKTRSLAHSILFYGTDIKAQYRFAKEIARILNCSENADVNCGCLNCNWIKNDSHPAILTVSKINNKPTDDDSKTVISIKQAHAIKNSLLTTSDYHRVFIFCDAEIVDGVWTPFGLNNINFQEDAANSLLKIIEEPPENTTFFFLTRDKNDLISTIISRSQCFYIPNKNEQSHQYSEIESLFADYFDFDRQDAFSIADNLTNLAKDFGGEKISDEIQNYLLGLLKANFDEKQIKTKIIKDMQAVEKTRQEISNGLQPQLAFEDLLLNITK